MMFLGSNFDASPCFAMLRHASPCFAKMLRTWGPNAGTSWILAAYLAFTELGGSAALCPQPFAPASARISHTESWVWFRKMHITSLMVIKVQGMVAIG